MKSLSYICLSVALMGTMLLMGQMTSTGDHMGKDMIEEAVADFMPHEDAALYSASVNNREVACDHFALPVDECSNCQSATAL